MPSDSRRHLALVLSRREDRRPRRQRRGQVVAAAHHGRRRPGLSGRGVGREGDEDRLPRRRSRSSIRPRTCAATSSWRSPTQRKLLDRFNEISAAFAEPDADFDKLLDEQARVQERIDTLDLWNLDNKIEIAMDALRLPPDDADVTMLSGGEKRRVALCRVLLEQPDMLLLDEPTNHLDAESVEWLERFLAEFPGHRRRDHARSLLPRQRREVDPRARPRQGNSVRGQLLELARAEAEAARSRRRRPRARASARCSASSSGCAWRRARDRRRARRASRSSRSSQAEDTGDKVLQHEITIPPPPRLGNDVVIAKGLKKAYGDKVLFDDLTFSLPRGGIVGVIGPNGAGKTTLFRMIIGEEKPDGGELKVGETVKLAYVDQGRVLDREQDGVSGSERRARRDHGRQPRDQRARVSVAVQLPRHGSAEEGRRSLGWRAQPSAPREAAEERRQRAAARRADERSRRRHAARARGSAARTSRVARW